MTLKDYLKYVVHGGALSRIDAARCCELLFASEASHTDIAGLLCALHARGETVDELSGFLATMRSNMTRVSCNDPNAIDMCGTGGDGSHSFNLSTAASLLAAACGVTVAKHGNRAVSSKSGSADILEALHIPLSTNAQDAQRLLDEKNFAFLFAPHFHPAMKSVAPVRKELGVRTIFNLLGPLANPAGVKRQLIGVYNPKWMRPLVETLAQSGSEFVITFHAEGGLDEITLAGDTHYCMLRDTRIIEGVWRAETWGAQTSSHEVILGGNALQNAERLLSVANGNEAELREWIIVNCAPALWIAGKVLSIEAGVSFARDCILSGAFGKYLDSLRTA
ncbi:MAG: anthranilate phosphoribosyltransferase [bacterium]|nr:anthranilate phosphoribosyltransferase [bacterium]